MCLQKPMAARLAGRQNDEFHKAQICNPSYSVIYVCPYCNLCLFMTSEDSKWSSSSVSSFLALHVAGQGITNFFIADARDLTLLLFIVVSSSVSAILIFFQVFLGAVE